MTYNPPPGFPPPGYPPQPPLAQYAAPPVAVRPVAVTVIAICGIIYASIGLLGIVFGVVTLFVVPGGGANPYTAALRDNHALLAWTIGSSAVGLVVTGLLLASSVGLLSLRPWARRGMIGWAVAAIVMGITGMIANWLWVHPMLEQVQRQQNVPEAVLMVSRVTSMCSGVVFGLVLPI